MQLLHGSISRPRDCAGAAFAYLDANTAAEARRDPKRRKDEKMAATTHITAHKGASLALPGSLFQAVRERFAAYRRYRRTLNELSQLTSRELADLGLHRSMLKSVALEAAKSGR